jgi:hypothetical protein
MYIYIYTLVYIYKYVYISIYIYTGRIRNKNDGYNGTSRAMPSYNERSAGLSLGCNPHIVMEGANHQEMGNTQQQKLKFWTIKLHVLDFYAFVCNNDNI